MSLIDLFKEFHSEAIQQEFPPSARVLYYTLLGEFNRAHWTDKLVLSERDLVQLTGLSPASVHRAKHFLASRHIIKCTPFKNKTAYSLGEAVAKQLRSSNEAVAKQSEQIPIIRVREDVKDVKTKTLGGTRTRELSEIWVAEMHRPLGASERYELAELEEIHGYDKVKSAIEQTKKSRYYPTFDDMKEKLLKGGEKVETASPSYTKPTRTGNEPWANY